MQGDFSRVTFDQGRRFSRVLMLQGRVLLDADWNEQTAILLHYLRSLAADLVGPYGGPAGPAGAPGGFALTASEKTFLIAPGRYYVQGILCENDQAVSYEEQAEYHPVLADAPLRPGSVYLAYLDVWERFITSLDDDRIREPALGGPDTASRARVVWQVKLADRLPDGVTVIPTTFGADSAALLAQWPEWIRLWQPEPRGLLRAKGREEPNADLEPCAISAEARYRGPENQLYRVEIHAGGVAGEATFVWSRENGSVLFPFESIAADQSQLTLADLGRESRFSLRAGDVVEVVDDLSVLHGRAEPLAIVEQVQPLERSVTLRPAGGAPAGRRIELANHPLLRRWDHGVAVTRAGAGVRGGALVVHEGSGDADWLALEDGIVIQFAPAPAGQHQTYRTGDAWLIPARTATGDVDWPGPVGQPEARPPHVNDHAYAPLALLGTDAAGAVTIIRPFTRRFIDLTTADAV